MRRYRCGVCRKQGPLWVALHYDKPVAICSPACWVAWWEQRDADPQRAAS